MLFLFFHRHAVMLNQSQRFCRTKHLSLLSSILSADSPTWTSKAWVLSILILLILFTICWTLKFTNMIYLLILYLLTATSNHKYTEWHHKVLIVVLLYICWPSWFQRPSVWVADYYGCMPGATRHCKEYKIFKVYQLLFILPMFLTVLLLLDCQLRTYARLLGFSGNLCCPYGFTITGWRS